MNLGSPVQQNVNSNLKLTLSSATGIQNAIGGLGNDKFTGNALDNTFTNGGGVDTYYFNTSSQLGADTIIDITGKGTVDFSGSTPDVRLNLGLAAQQIVNANLKLTLSSATGIQNIVGGLGNDKLTGNTLNNTFTGGGGADTYYFNTSSQLGADTIIDSTGKGTIDFTGSTPGVSLNLGSTAQQNVNSNLKLTLSSATGIQNVTGGIGNDSLTGNGLANTIVGGDGEDILVGGTGDTLSGGDGNDSLYINTTSSHTLVSGLGGGTTTVVDGGNGRDWIEVMGNFPGTANSVLIDSGNLNYTGTSPNPNPRTAAGSKTCETVYVHDALIDGLLQVTGAQDGVNANNSVYVSSSTAGNLSVTLGNGSDLYTQQLCKILGNATIQLGGGNNYAYIAGLTTATVATLPNTITGNLQVTGGAGDDQIILDHVSVQGTVRIDGGAGGTNVIGIKSSSLIKSNVTLLNFTKANQYGDYFTP